MADDSEATQGSGSESDSTSAPASDSASPEDEESSVSERGTDADSPDEEPGVSESDASATDIDLDELGDDSDESDDEGDAPRETGDEATADGADATPADGAEDDTADGDVPSGDVWPEEDYQKPDIAATTDGRPPGAEADPEAAALDDADDADRADADDSAPADAEDTEDADADPDDAADGSDAPDDWPDAGARSTDGATEESPASELDDASDDADLGREAPPEAESDSEDWPEAERDDEDVAETAPLVDDDPAASEAVPEVGTVGDDPEPYDDEFVREGPESDEEMPLADHIEEMVRRLAVVFAVGGLVTLVLYPGGDIASGSLGMDLVSATDVINYLWNKHIPGAPEIVDRRPRVYGPLELVLTELKVAGLAGLVVGLPVFVYETYLFMRPGLYPKERRYYLAAVPTSLILAIIGVAFAHFIVLPAIFAYFTSYTQGTAVIAFGLKETFNLILILMGYNAVIFQIPLFIMLAIMMNLVTRIWLEDRRLLFWGAFLGLAFFVSPDPTGMAPIIIAATMITLFEGTLLLLRWTGN
jgi:sec-independent protein translocase protein TatC